MNYYSRLAIVILLVIGIAQFAPDIVNTLLVLVIISMLILNAEQFSKLLTGLRLS